jgi:hypothetical protein
MYAQNIKPEGKLMAQKGLKNESRDAQLSKAEALFSAAFNDLREPRSLEYKRGVMAILNFRCAGIRQDCPYKAGSVERDAYLAGCDEGHTIWRRSRQ